MCKLFSNNSEDKVLPEFVGHKLLAFAVSDLPSTAFGILLVFPGWLHAFYEHIDLGAWFELIWSLNVLIYAPELLN